MRIWATRLMAILLALSMLLSAAPAARAAATAPPPPPGAESTGESIGRTPPRLSYMNGEVSFWRPGAADWGPAQVNTPLAPGDELYTGANPATSSSRSAAARSCGRGPTPRWAWSTRSPTSSS